ncbi:MAG: integrase family protein [Bradyrhizobium sp.]|nr:integrase family protein [Bradyrhizobium sp.]
MRYPEIPPFKTKVIRLLEGDLFVYTEDAEGNWVDWPNLYCVVELRPTSISLSTMRARMDAVCQFHNWCASKGIDARARVDSATFFTKAEVEGLRREMRVNLLTRPGPQSRGGRRKPKSAVVTKGQWRARCAAVREYITWHAEEAIQRMSVRDERLGEARARLADFRRWMSKKIRTHRNVSREGMDPTCQAVFLRAITPGDPSNPFALRHQHRNYALWRCYYDGGVRRSEALGLKGEDLKLNGDDPRLIVHRRPDDADDVRAIAPNTKTLPYSVLLTAELSGALHTYVVKHRTKVAGAKRSPYVFISQMGRPLSISSVHYMIEQLRTVPGMPGNFTTHLLRYGWNDRFGEAAEKLGWTAEEEKQVRNQHQGWTQHSDQGQDYQRGRNRKRGQQIASAMQDAATKGAA